MKTVTATDEIRIDSYLEESDERSLANDVLDGLTRPFKELPPKHFYDARGSFPRMFFRRALGRVVHGEKCVVQIL